MARASDSLVPGRRKEDRELHPDIAENIKALLELRKEREQERTFQDRFADGVTEFVGSIKFVVAELLVVIGWITANLGWVPGIHPFDPFPFVMLAVIVSVEAIFLSTFILMSQRRMSRIASDRDDLDVQINLLSEHEVTRLLQMTDAIAKHLNVPLQRTPDLESLKENVSATDVIEKIEEESGKKGLKK